MAIHRVIVRMYKHLLGDCFLIRIEDSGSNRYILIDCGLLQGLDKADERMTKIAENIAATTRNRLDLLIVTHEHWDHISGFSQAREIFFDPARLSIDRLWMAWTEKPGDPQADQLRAHFDGRKLALTALATALRADGAPETDGVLLHLHNFIGPTDDAPGGPGLGMMPTGRLTGRRIMGELQKAAASIDFLEPGQVVATPGADPLRVAVLGPPRKEVRLFKDRPSSGDAKETYLAEQMLVESVLGLDGEDGRTVTANTDSPFPPHYAKVLDTASVKSAGGKASDNPDAVWLHDRYFADLEPAAGPPGGERLSQAFRRIDDLGDGTASLALKLDSDTNNTSLALAFELPDNTFMLFAADAQVGNWLSWHDQDYAFGPTRLSAGDILGATRLYKVGHHGSHNATLAGKGLQMMTRGDLVAMVSTVREEAAGQGQGWEMPDKDVNTALHEVCQGRVLVGDRKWADDPDVSAAHRKAAAGFAAAIDEKDPLYVDYTIYPARH